MIKDNTKVVTYFNHGSVEILNSFNYPSNVEKMTDTVRGVVEARLKKAFASFTNHEFEVDIASLLNQNGVSFDVKNIKFIDAAYLMISADIKDIDFKVLSKKGKRK